MTNDITIVVSSTLWLECGDVIRLDSERKFFVYFEVVSVSGTTMTVRRLGWIRTTMWWVGAGISGLGEAAWHSAERIWRWLGQRIFAMGKSQANRRKLWWKKGQKLW